MGFENVCDVLARCMDSMLASVSWKDPTPALPSSLQSNLSGVVIFETLSTVLRQFFLRFKGAVIRHPGLVPLMDRLSVWFGIWSNACFVDPVAFGDYLEPGHRKLTEGEMKRNIERLQDIVQREHRNNESRRKIPEPASLKREDKHEALLTRLWQTYDPPGVLRENGHPRNDNDKVDIADIRIVPTHEELLCDTRPYLPVNIDSPETPHHCAAGSMERHLDIQFRLLREELTAPIRDAIGVLQADFNTIATRRRVRNQPAPPLTQIEQVIQKKGGMYRTSGRNSVMFQVYTNVELSPLETQRRGFTVGLVIDAPSGDARNSDRKVRQEYWKRSRRLASGSLVGFVIVQNNQIHVALGNISSSNTEISESAKVYADRVEVRVQFFDPEVELKALRREKVVSGASSFAVLIDNGIMFEALRPFLETLQSMEPTSIPFYRYISQRSPLDTVDVHPPRYASSPTFRFNLECVAKDGQYIHPLNATDPQSVLRARHQLQEFSGLDPSQCEAMVDVLTREVALIQGPPGTGKVIALSSQIENSNTIQSFTGKEILRVLFANKVKPVVLIAFTNHALDHMLRSVLDAKITKSFVRIGSRSSDEIISQYTLDKFERQAEDSSLKRSMSQAYGEMKDLEKRMREILDSIQLPKVSWEDIEGHLADFHPDHLTSFTQPPYWIDQLFQQALGDPAEEDHGSGWTTVTGKGKSGKSQNINIDSIYAFWKYSQDIQFIRPPPQPAQQRRGKKNAQSTTQETSQKQLEYKERMRAFFAPLGFINDIPKVPNDRRDASSLLSCLNVWSLSEYERAELASFWEEAIRSSAYNSNLDEYNSIRREYERVCSKYNNIKDENRRRLLSRTDLIGCTTNGAAKLTSLLTTVAPKVLLVEEAGQVLEAHIIASLVPSVQHLICIGDPQQLRPTLANYNISMDSDRGRELYKFDRSLMERLAENGFPMSQINVQRRMRPSISNHIRNILYPRLEDHDKVTRYPPVQGMQKDIFFFSHTNKENGGEESVSKSNDFEVAMIVELVKYFLKQDAYSAPGDIAVLCAYLGQLQKVRSALKDLRISVSLDERDSDDLVRQGMEDEHTIEEVVVARHIRLGTVDVFQGDEAKIVIVSLVRNSGTFEADGAPIGFLKSSNRINVALSRAQHGLYIFGNAANLRQNDTWKTIIDEMEDKDELVTSMTICMPPYVASSLRRSSQIANTLLTCLVPAIQRLSPAVQCAAESWIVVGVYASHNAMIALQKLAPTMFHLQLNAQVTRSTHANVAYIVNINATLPAQRSINVIDSAATRVDSDAVTISAPDRAERIVPPAQKHANGHVPTFPALSYAVRYAHVCHVINHVFRNSRVVISVRQSGKSDKMDIVDLVLQRTLAEVSVSDDPSDRLIRLECGHLFTVETLDGHCHMSDYYEIDAMTGSYIAMKAPPIDFQSPPTCPACRKPISARRYGRITKRANLDILEQNVASSMAQSLEAVGPIIQNLVNTLPEIETRAKDIPFESASQKIEDLPTAKRLDVLSQKSTEVMSPTLLTQNSMQTHHGLSNQEGKAWYEVTKVFQAVYKKVATIARTRSAHTRAYEQALSTLYWREFSRLGSDSEQVALNNVHKMLGQPPPKADVRYHVEAFLISVEIRFMLAQLARSRIDSLTVTSNDPEVHNHHRLWTSFTDFLYHSCEVDCRKAIKMAEASFSSRLAARSVVLVFRAEFERFRFSILEKRKEHIRAANMSPQVRRELVQEINEREAQWRKFIVKAEQSYLRSRPTQTIDDTRAERAWFRDNCLIKFKRILDELPDFVAHIERDTVYQPLSHQEMEDVVKAFGFTHRGHFYNCPNGHPFVITECGGAMQASRCPECGAPIGGSDHSLDASNTRAMEFEEIAGRQGAERSPWAWAAGA
ncbi:hypothetical protein VNI00_000931 [Paramarasmius palmivorus]|uniref:RZ-type domain-containing protein n=1 Tax=Paramarasmius palmivorus TaxID=297713 RepID=A0AAW0E8B4_9AGAR